MWWYFFTEMFDHFRHFFLGVFQVGTVPPFGGSDIQQLHCLIYVVPVTARLGHDPLSGILVLVGVISAWKSYPTVGDMALWSGLLACFPELLSSASVCVCEGGN